MPLLRAAPPAFAIVFAIASPTAAQTSPTQGPPDSRELDVFYTGFTGGLSSEHIEFAELAPLFQPDVLRDFEVGGFVSDNVFRRGDFVLYTEAGPLTLEDFQGFFATGPIALSDEGPQPLLASDYAYVLATRSAETGQARSWPLEWLLGTLQKQGGFSDVRHVNAHRYQLKNADGLQLYLLALGDAPPPKDLWDDPTLWEMLTAGTVSTRRAGTRTELLAIGRPLGDGLRRSHLLQGLRKQVNGASLTVDAGNLLDPGFTELSREQREFTLLRLHDLAYDMVVPAETELELSASDWKRLNSLVPLVAANLSARDGSRSGLPSHLVKMANGLKIALIGLVDDQALELFGATGPRSAWKATNALISARAEVEALSPLAPDVVLIVTNVRGARLEELRQLAGVTAVLGDFNGLPGDIFTEQVDVKGQRRTRAMTTYMVAKASPNRVGHFTGLYDVRPGGARPLMRALRNEAHLVTDVLPEDEGWRWQLNVTLDRYQSARRVLLLPDLRDAAAAYPGAKLIQSTSLPALDKPRWSRLIANILREATGAEVAVTREIPVGRTLIGPVSQLSLENWLDLGDHVISTELSGRALKALVLSDANTHLLVFGGYDPASQKIMGVSVDDDEHYRVTTTDFVARHALFEDNFDKRPLLDRWTIGLSGAARAVAIAGQPLYLRDLVLGALKALKFTHSEAFSAGYMHDYVHLLTATGETSEARWVARLDDGQLLLNGYQNRGSEAYSQVRNTRVTTPDSLSFGGKGKFDVTWDSPAVAWENRAKAIYKRASLKKNGIDLSQKADDEVVLSSELRVKALSVPSLSLWSPTPFISTSYTTQFQPDDTEDGASKPRRAELNAVGGIVLYPALGFKDIRLGALVKNDLARPGALEPGAQFVANFERKFDRLPITLQAALDAKHYLPTVTDGPDRLGWDIDLNSTLTLPVWERFTLNLSADYFLYRGKLQETSSWGSSLDFRVGLGYSLAFKPLYGILY